MPSEASKDNVLKIIEDSNKIAILSGAGVSTPSGMKDFRGKDGLYNKKVYGLNPEQILSKKFFNTYRDLFYKYYIENLSTPNTVEPNEIHLATKRLADSGKLSGVVTQNIDGLYQKAGLPEDKLVEAHGNGSRWVCTKCKKPTEFNESRYNEKTGNYLSACHDFLIRPDIVLYDEVFDIKEVKRADAFYEEATLLIVMGTSLDIIPHAQSVLNFRGKIILLNNQYIELWSRQWDGAYIGSIENIFNEELS